MNVSLHGRSFVGRRWSCIHVAYILAYVGCAASMGAGTVGCSSGSSAEADSASEEAGWHSGRGRGDAGSEDAGLADSGGSDGSGGGGDGNAEDADSGDGGDGATTTEAGSSYPPEPTTPIVGCDDTGQTDVTACISDFIAKHSGPAFYLAAGTYGISGQIIITSKRLYGNNSTSNPTRLVAAKGAHGSALQIEGTSPAIDWIELDADNSNARSSQPEDDCLNIDGAQGTPSQPVLVANCTLKNCASGGIFNNDWDIGPSNWVVIAGNHVFNSGADCIHNSTYNATPIQNLLVEYNLVEQCGDDGVAVGAYSSTTPTTNVVVQHNTVHNQNWAQGVSEWVPCSPPGSCIVRNNYFYQDDGYVSTVTGSTDSHACIMLESSPTYGGIGPANWVNQDNDCINRGAYQGHSNYMMWNGGNFSEFEGNSFSGNTSKDAHADCFLVEETPQIDETIENNICAAPVGALVNDTTGQVTQSGNQVIADSAYKAVNSPGGGPGSDPNYP